MSDPSSVVSQRGGMLGVYPLQIIDESTLNQIGFIDVIVSGPSEFELKDYIFDMTKTYLSKD